mmetsp:Transcript_10325/g.30304  ORF Transcript_10325/g.30304 Transcript_10325/m.30304 type:complete len:312 (+) Transcript_10325:48-983(+)
MDEETYASLVLSLGPALQAAWRSNADRRGEAGHRDSAGRSGWQDFEGIPPGALLQAYRPRLRSEVPPERPPPLDPDICDVLYPLRGARPRSAERGVPEEAAAQADEGPLTRHAQQLRMMQLLQVEQMQNLVQAMQMQQLTTTAQQYGEQEVEQCCRSMETACARLERVERRLRAGDGSPAFGSPAFGNSWARTTSAPTRLRPRMQVCCQRGVEPPLEECSSEPGARPLPSTPSYEGDRRILPVQQSAESWRRIQQAHRTEKAPSPRLRTAPMRSERDPCQHYLPVKSTGGVVDAWVIRSRQSPGDAVCRAW